MRLSTRKLLYLSNSSYCSLKGGYEPLDLLMVGINMSGYEEVYFSLGIGCDDRGAGEYFF